MSQTITLEEIKSQQNKLQSMIARYESGKLIENAFPISVSMPDLNDGEKWVGCMISADGLKAEHTILLPGESERASWSDQVAWAESIGGHLPDRCEQAMLYKFMKDEFKEEAYWSSETHANNAGWAWSQGFGNGAQHYTNKSSELRARAVRRLSVIQ